MENKEKKTIRTTKTKASANKEKVVVGGEKLSLEKENNIAQPFEQNNAKKFKTQNDNNKSGIDKVSNGVVKENAKSEKPKAEKQKVEQLDFTSQLEMTTIEYSQNEQTVQEEKPQEELPGLKLDKVERKRISKLRKNKNWSLENATRYKPSNEKGLSKKQVKERFENGYLNIVEDKNRKTYLKIFLTNICTFFNLLCFVVAGALIAVGAGNNIFFLAIVVANMAIGIIQEIRAKKTIEKINVVTAPTATVIREGVKQDIHTDEIVLDDILEFTLGKQICTDCIVTAGEVDVNESNLTGESVPIKKKVGDKLLSGSFVTSGSCLARADSVGNDNYSAKLASKAREYKKPQSQILKTLKLLIKIIGIIIIPLGILMLYNNFSQAGDVEAIKKTAGSIIGMIPAGMFLLTSVALAVGVVKLAKRHTLVQDLYSIEMLSRVDVLCLDKTGTITDGTMNVSKTYKFDANLSDEDLENTISSMMSALGGNNSTSQALIAKFGNQNVQKPIAILPFSSARKLSAVTFAYGNTFVIGAPEFVLGEVPEKIAKIANQCANLGQRVLVLAKGRGKIVNEQIPKELKPIALIAIEDRIRDDAEKTLQWFRQNDVNIKVISGDDPITVSVIGKRVGVPHAEKYINLYGMNEKQVIDAANKYTIFGRVTPEQKCLLIKAFKQSGHTVAMTGDGVNDILALKEADCSIARASGSDATKNVSNLVLLDSNFASMPSIVSEGRRVINNITKSSSLFLMKTLFTMFLSIVCLIFNLAYPFSPNMVLLLEIFAIGIPSFFLALQPNKEPIKGNFLLNLLKKALPGGILLLIAFIACYLFDKTAGTGKQYETMASIAIAFCGLVLLYKICRPIDAYRLILFIACVGLCLATLVIVPSSFFGYVNLDFQSWLFIVIVVEFGFLWLLKPIEKDKVKEWEPEKNIKDIIDVDNDFEDLPSTTSLLDYKKEHTKQEEKQAKIKT